ncbi:hypothetical protein [Streptomyces sp. IBSBF 2435]|uniref:hypothetical protein n=1 Tax=Streptomyces sp. IBSBF 2435 TaxID=2903531 RepID=UPI002FDC63CE
MTFSNIVGSQVIVGNGNVALQVTLGGASALTDRSPALPAALRELPVFRALPGRRPLVGRTGLVEPTAADLLAGRTVQLCGADGAGRLAVAEAVVARLAEHGVRGVQLLGGTEPHTLESLYRRLAELLLGVVWHQPDEAVLRTDTARLRPSGVIVVTDCDLPAADLDRLVGTFPDCVFLLTSQRQTLHASGVVRDVPALGQDQARELVEQRLGRRLSGIENVQVARAHELAEGQAARLVVLAAFLERAVADPRSTRRLDLPVPDQIALLISGLSEPALRGLIALGSYGPLPAALFGPLTGLPAAGAGAELERAGLAQLHAGTYAVTADCASVLARTGEVPDARVAAEGLLLLIREATSPSPAAGEAGAGGAGPNPAAPVPGTVPAASPVPLPDARLCLAVAQALVAAGAKDTASRLIRASGPPALAGGSLTTWAKLAALGVQCATAAGRPEDLEYFLNEQHTGALVRGDRIAAAAALAALAELLAHPGVIPHLGGAAHHGSHLASGGRETARVSRARRVTRASRRVLSAGHGAAGVGVAVVVVAAAASAVALTGGHSSPSGARVSPPAAPGDAGSTTTATGPVRLAFSAHDDSSSHGAPSPYRVQAKYPVASGMADAAVQNTVNAELRAPVDRTIASFTGRTTQQDAGIPGTDPATLDISYTVYQTGKVVSVKYLAYVHNSGAADVSYEVFTVTLRTDKGALLGSDDILAPAAYTQAGIDTLSAGLQALPEISDCDSQPGWSSADLRQTLSDMRTKGGVALNVTPAGIEFSFGDDTISGTACQPVGLLPLSGLVGLVEPSLAALVGPPEPIGSTPPPTGTAAPATRART